MTELLGLTPGELAERLDGSGRARAVYRAIAEGQDPFEALTSGARRRLAAACSPTVAEVRACYPSSDGTLKLLLGFEDGRAVECVLIVGEDRTTACLSTQVGCARGCTFCRTATMGLVRNLSCAEIVAQVQVGLREVRDRSMPPLRNLVYMGMGEPLDNLDAVARSLAIITSGVGLGFGPRHVTVSSVGTTRRAIAAAAALPARLAWSLHAADDELRRTLVPTARRTVAELAADFYTAVDGTSLFVEVVLLDGVNDDDRAADAIVALFEGAPCEVRVNLLPMNPIDDAARGRPSGRADAFRDRLRRAGLFCMVRRPRGAERLAACGQLAVLTETDLPAGVD